MSACATSGAGAGSDPYLWDDSLAPGDVLTPAQILVLATADGSWDTDDDDDEDRSRRAEDSGAALGGRGRPRAGKGFAALMALFGLIFLVAGSDLFVFGGPSRLAYHGVPKTLPGTGDPGIGLGSGRLNITLRESGLA